MLEFKDTDLVYVTEAVELAVKEYDEECAKNPHLLHADFREQIAGMLDYLFQQKYGKVALQDGKLMGYIAFSGPWDGFFGNVKGVFSPLGGNAFAGAERGKLASMLFEELAREMVEDNVCTYALSRYAHDEEVGRSFVMNGFGIRCSDAMLHLKDRKVAGQLESDLEFGELTGAEKGQIRKLKQGLVRHLGSSPTFLPSDIGDFEQSVAREGVRIFSAKVNGKIAGYLSLNMDDAETFITEHDKVANICGAFFEKEYRGKGIANQLLEYVCQTCTEEGMGYVGVDCETINPNALRFWSKYFSMYTYSYVRRIDERAVGYNSYLDSVWGK